VQVSCMNTAINPEDILTPGELAKRLKVSVDWIYEKSRERGRHGGKPLPCLRVGRYLRFCWPDVCVWMRSK
jgi:hypothetical protein